MGRTVLLRGIELRYVLTVMLANCGQMEVHEMTEELERQNFSVIGRPSKAVSDALRWEVREGRAIRYAHGRYGPGTMPRSTEHRIWRRWAKLKSEADELWWDDIA